MKQKKDETSTCQSGEWSGENCQWSGEESELTRMKFVPNYLRGTADAAGSWSGLSQTIRVCPDCAEQMRECDAEWVE